MISSDGPPSHRDGYSPAKSGTPCEGPLWSCADRSGTTARGASGRFLPTGRRTAYVTKFGSFVEIRRCGAL